MSLPPDTTLPASARILSTPAIRAALREQQAGGRQQAWSIGHSHAAVLLHRLALGPCLLCATTLPHNTHLTCAGDAPGRAANSSAAAPETTGVAMLVPLARPMDVFEEE